MGEHDTIIVGLQTSEHNWGASPRNWFGYRNINRNNVLSRGYQDININTLKLTRLVFCSPNGNIVPMGIKPLVETQ